MAVNVAHRDPRWNAYRASRNPAIREELILRYLPLVRAVARQLLITLPRSVLGEDLEAYGTVGLIEAVDRFDPDQGIRFETFAWPRIRGAILDHLRTLDVASRSDRHLARRIQRAFEQESLRQGRPATDEEAASALGIGVADLHEEMGRLREIIVYSVEDMVWRAGLEGFRGAPPDPMVEGPAEAIERSEILGALRESIGDLPDREKLVLGLYYYERLTLAEIANILGVTESRVCQIQAGALLRLRAALTRRGFYTADT